MTSQSNDGIIFGLQEILAESASISEGLRVIQSQSSSALALETIVQLCVGAPCPNTVSPPMSPEDWATARTRLYAIFAEKKVELMPLPSNGTKRTREGEAEPDSGTALKKAKLITVDDHDDPPVFTLHAISFTSPIRKKADVTVHRHSLRFTDPKDSKSNLCDPIPISQLRRAFLISTPGKTKPHWTAMILPDSTIPADAQPVIFGCDATLSTQQTTTKYPNNPETHAKGTASKSLIHSLFAYFPSGPEGLIDLYEPKPADFQSGSGGQSIDAYIGAKDGHLHFFSHGVLWGEKKPVLWFPLDEIVDMHTGISSGRSFTLYISTRRLKSKKEGMEKEKAAGGEAQDDEEQLEMHDFSLIDSKEEQPVKKWIAIHKQEFTATVSSNNAQVDGLSSAAAAASSGSKASVPGAPVRPSGPVKLMDAVLDEDDEEDDDFVGSDDSDSEKASGSSSDEGPGEEEEDKGDDDEDEAMESEDESPHAGPSSTNRRLYGEVAEDNDEDEAMDELDGEEEQYQAISIPAGMRVSKAAAAEAEKLMGKAFGL